MKKFSTAAALIGAVGLAGSAYAQPIELFTDQVTKMKFVNYERLIKNTPGTSIVAGDQFEGILNVEAISNISGSLDKDAQLLTKELTGHFRITVATGSAPLNPTAGTGHLDFVLGAGDFINLYVGTGATKNWDPAAVDAITRASDGALWASILGGGLSYEGTNDSALIPVPLSLNRNWADLDVNATGYTIVPKPYATTAGEPVFHFKDLNSNGAYDLGEEAGHNVNHLVDVYFASRLFDNSSATDGTFPIWQFRSEDPVYVYCTTIPEPSTFLLLGAGLLGVGVAARRRVKS